MPRHDILPLQSGTVVICCVAETDECLDRESGQPITACQNGASCVDALLNFTCECALGYTGDFCEIGNLSLLCSVSHAMAYTVYLEILIQRF